MAKKSAIEKNKRRQKLVKHREFLLGQQETMRRIESDIESMGERIEAGDGRTVLVVAGGQADAIFEGEAECVHRLAGRVEQRAQHGLAERQHARQAQGVQCEMVGAFSVEPEQQWPNPRIHRQ